MRKLQLESLSHLRRYQSQRSKRPKPQEDHQRVSEQDQVLRKALRNQKSKMEQKKRERKSKLSKKKKRWQKLRKTKMKWDQLSRTESLYHHHTQFMSSTSMRKGSTDKTSYSASCVNCSTTSKSTRTTRRESKRLLMHQLIRSRKSSSKITAANSTCL